MKITKTKFKDLLIINNKIFKDSRGYFKDFKRKYFKKKFFSSNVIFEKKIQDCICRKKFTNL